VKRRITLSPSHYIEPDSLSPGDADPLPAKTNVLVIGVGSIGERHTRCFQQSDRAEVSICEVNEALRDDVAARYGLAAAYSDWNEALDSRFDAAVICTPAHLHVPMAIELAQRGKHLLIEKPLSTTLDRIEELRGAIAAAQVRVMVAYVMRGHPGLQALKAALDSDRFGRPVHAICNSGQHFPTYRPAYREIYYKDRATGGGAIQDGLTHMMNSAEWLLGPIDRVAADCAHQVLPGVEVEDTVNVLARHGDVLGSYTLNQHQAPNESSFTIVCQRGTIRFESHLERWRWITEPETPWTEEPLGHLERDDLFITQANRFLDVVADTAPPPCTLEDGIQTLRVNLAILSATESQQWVEVQS
jgi:predicted dehydrogenase